MNVSVLRAVSSVCVVWAYDDAACIRCGRECVALLSRGHVVLCEHWKIVKMLEIFFSVVVHENRVWSHAATMPKFFNAASR